MRHRRALHIQNRAATGLRMAAFTLWRRKTFLAANRRRMRARLGAREAITTMATTVSRLVCRMLRYGGGSFDKGMQFYEDKYRAHEILSLQRKAKQPGVALTLTPAA